MNCEQQCTLKVLSLDHDREMRSVFFKVFL